MEVEPVGIIVAAIGAALCLFGTAARIWVGIGSLVFTTTAIVSLPALGGAAITVPQFGLGCLALACVTRPGAMDRFLQVLRDEPAAQALMLFTVYAVLSALFFPRLFQNETPVFTLARVAETIIRVPLGPSSGNITQALYLVAGICAFFFVAALVRDAADFRLVLQGFTIYIALNAVCGLADAIGKYGAGQDVLSVLRTAKYTMLTDVDIGGVWRLSGTYSEASAFAFATAGQIVFCYLMWRAGMRGLLWPALFLLLAVLDVLSTSSSSYVFLGLAAVGFAVVVVKEIADDAIERTTLIMLAAIAVGFVAVLAATLMSAGVLRIVTDLADTLLLDKLTSDSGVERSSWNRQALDNLFDTAGLGIGLGSARSSSWVLSLLSQVGVPGAILFAVFVLCLFTAPGRVPHGLSDVGAARQAFLGYTVAALLAASISWALVDLGPAFYVAAAGVVCSRRVIADSRAVPVISSPARRLYPAGAPSREP